MQVCVQTHFVMLTAPTREVVWYQGEYAADNDPAVLKNPGNFKTVGAVTK